MEEKHVTKEEVWAGFAEVRAMNAENARGLKDLKVEVADLVKTVKEVSRHMGGLSDHVGDSAEEHFATALEAKMEFAGQHFDSIDRNLSRGRNGLQDEFDIVLSNGVAVAIIEVKHRACQADVEKLATKKLTNFRALYPIYKDYKIYLGIGSMSFDKRTVKKAQELGVGMIHQKGDILEADTTHIQVY
jgi:hypothetical protein